jgi:YidC/Oxa1 family membrane protein insertase
MTVTANIFQPLIDVFESVITFLYDNLGIGWGMSIVLLTFLVRLVILPLSIKQIRGMRQLQIHAPELKAIQERYKDDPQRQQREMLAFYKENDFNPLASCLPLVLQMPVFFAMFGLLRSASFKEDVISSGDPGFLFIDSLVANPTGVEAAILIVCIIASSLAIFLLQPSTTGSNTQRYILAGVFTLLFAFFVPQSPAGLSVYWTATGVWALGQQLVVQRVMPPPPPPSEEQIKARTAPPPPPPRKKKKRR